MTTKVHFSRTARKQFDYLPKQTQRQLLLWVELLEEEGLLEMRKDKSYNDEPLQGKRKGQRSVRLNLKWRAIYQETNNGIEIQLLEVTSHDYRSR